MKQEPVNLSAVKSEQEISSSELPVSTEALTATTTSSTTDYPVSTIGSQLLSKQQQRELLQKALLLKAQLATAIQRSAVHSAAALLMHTSAASLGSASVAGGDGQWATPATDEGHPSSSATFAVNTDTESVAVLHGTPRSKDLSDIEMGASSLDEQEDVDPTGTLFSTVKPPQPVKNEEFHLQSTAEDNVDHSALNAATDQESLESELHCCPKCDFTTTQINHFKFHILSHIIIYNNAYAATSHTFKDSTNGALNAVQQDDVENPHINNLALTQDFAESLGSKFNCSICQFFTSDEQVFKFHLLNHTAQSDHSSMSSTNPYSLAESGAESAADAVMRGLSKKFYCPICRFCSVSKANFDRHLASHVRDGRICCDKCLFSTESIEEIRAHVAMHYSRNNARISCPHCDFTTANKSYFKVHLATHTGEGKMYCSYCSYSTVYKSNFRQHVAAHENKTEMQCPLCDFKCVCKSEYGLHFATHTGEKRLACPFCKFNTSNKSYFKQHVGSHTGAGKLACPFCKFSTVNKSYYRIHVSKHTGEGTLKCSLCPFTTVYKNNFRRHIAKHQTVEEESLKIVAAISDQQRKGRWKTSHSQDADQMSETYSSFGQGRAFDDENDPHSSSQEANNTAMSSSSERDSPLTFSFSNSQDVQIPVSSSHFTDAGQTTAMNNIPSALDTFDSSFDPPTTTQDSSSLQRSCSLYGNNNSHIAGSAKVFLTPDKLLALQNNDVSLSLVGGSTPPISKLPQGTLLSQVDSDVDHKASVVHKKDKADHPLLLALPPRRD